MSHLRGHCRSEVELLPPCVDDYVPANAPVRFIDVFAEGLDLAALGFSRSTAAETGRPPYHPGPLWPGDPSLWFAGTDPADPASEGPSGRHRHWDFAGKHR